MNQGIISFQSKKLRSFLTKEKLFDFQQNFHNTVNIYQPLIHCARKYNRDLSVTYMLL